MSTAPLRPVWLSHHGAHEADRCVRIGGVPVCRRCLAMTAGFLPALALLLSPWRHELQAGDVGLVLALTIVAGIDFVQVATGRVAYSARRVLVLNPFAGMVLAWLAVTGARDGLGPAHFVLGGAAAALLALLVVRARLSHRTAASS